MRRARIRATAECDQRADLPVLVRTPRSESIRTLGIYVDALKRFRQHVGDVTPLEAISGAAVVRFFTYLRSTGVLSPATVNKVKRTLNSAFNVAKDQFQYIKSNPCAGIKKDKLAETDNRYVTPEEFAELRETCSGTFNPLWWETFITLCYTAGVRRDEAVHLLWTDIDLEEGTIRTVAKQGIAGVPDWHPKDYDARTIPVPDETVKLLRALRIEAGFGSKMVFVSSLRLAWMQQQQDAGKWKEGQLTLNNLGRGFRAIAKRASVEKVSLHDLRRSAITHWARMLPSHVVQRLAGHSSITTTLKYYLSVQPDELMRAKDAVALALLSDAKRTQMA